MSFICELPTINTLIDLLPPELLPPPPAPEHAVASKAIPAVAAIAASTRGRDRDFIEQPP
jgi:hypothetical protein